MTEVAVAENRGKGFDLAQFDELRAQVTALVEPLMSLQVSSPKVDEDARDAGKKIQAMLKKIDERRKAILAPLREQIEEIQAYCTQLTEPIEAAKKRIGDERSVWARKVEEDRQAELRRIELERKRLEAEAAEKRRKAEEEARREQERIAREAETQREALEAEAIAAQSADELFGGGSEESDSTAQADALGAAIDEEREARVEAARKAAEQQAALERESFQRARELEKQEKAANQAGVKGARVDWRFEVTDPGAVPRTFCEPSDKLIRAAVASGAREIPGVRIYEHTSVAVGR